MLGKEVQYFAIKTESVVTSCASSSEDVAESAGPRH